MPFQISALPAEPFAHLFGQPDAVLKAHGALRITVDVFPGFPCRASLEDASIGESVLLLNFLHQPAASPYQASHAIFVRENVTEAVPAPGEVPDQLRRRLLWVRVFDGDGMMIEADLVDGQNLEGLTARLFAGQAVRYLHAHNAKQSCYAARVDRLSGWLG